MRIPVAAPGRWFAAHARELASAQARVARSGQYILGPEVSACEEEFAAFCGAGHAVAVASGTDALALSLQALGATGGEVITSGHTTVATVAAIEHCGATPVLADIDPASRCLDPVSVGELINSGTRAIVAVHIYGHPAAMDALQALTDRTGIALVEDCAQAHGARLGERPVGSIGDAGAFSFYPTKILGAMGDAGAVTTDDSRLADELRRLRQYGWDAGRVARTTGCNSRMDDLQAAVIRLRLRHFDADFRRRRAIADCYSAALGPGCAIEPPRSGAGVVHAFNLYVVESDARDDLAAFLAGRGIETARHYELPVHRHPAYARLRRAGPLRNVEALYDRALSLPLYPELSDEEVSWICDALAQWAGREDSRTA